MPVNDCFKQLNFSTLFNFFNNTSSASAGQPTIVDKIYETTSRNQAMLDRIKKL